MPKFINLAAGFRSVLSGAKDFKFEFYVDCMDLTRAPGEGHRDKIMEWDEDTLAEHY